MVHGKGAHTPTFEVKTITIPPVIVIVGDMQHILRKAPPSTPYWDLLEYKHFRMLDEENLQDLANFYNRSLQGEPFEDVFAGGFTLCPTSYLMVPWQLPAPFSISPQYGKSSHH